MVERRFLERDPAKVQQATSAFLLREVDGQRQILLGAKKRGFGMGLWNGVGGKVDGRETIEFAAKREIGEEIDLKPLNLDKVAVLHFYFPDDPEKRDWNQDVHVFLVTDWQGNPWETGEVRPQWFTIIDIPFHLMWDDNSYWLPRVLAGEKIEGWFCFGSDNKVSAYLMSELNL